MKFITTIALVFTYYTSVACDVCGAVSNNQSLGILPQYYKHFVGIQYQYRSFNSVHPSVFEGMPSQNSSEYYQTVQIWGKVNISNRLQLFAFVPYQYNNQQTDVSSISIRGMGDASLLAMGTIVRTPDSVKNVKHLLLAGAGIKAPTANMNKTATLGNALNLQTGTGSWDIVLSGNYTIRNNKSGVNTDVSYVITTPSSNYKYGNRFSMGITGFLWYKTGNWALQPQVGIRYDLALHDYNNYSQKWLDRNTGGYISYTNIGIQLFHKRIGLQTNYAIPIWHNYAKGNVKAISRYDIGLLYFF